MPQHVEDEKKLGELVEKADGFAEVRLHFPAASCRSAEPFSAGVDISEQSRIPNLHSASHASAVPLTSLSLFLLSLGVH